jgi:hypothetical protein
MLDIAVGKAEQEDRRVRNAPSVRPASGRWVTTTKP